MIKFLKAKYIQPNISKLYNLPFDNINQLSRRII